MQVIIPSNIHSNFYLCIGYSWKEFRVEYLDVIAESRRSLIYIHEVLKKSGAFKDQRVRSALVEYSLLKAIGELGTILDDLYDIESKQPEVRTE